MNSSATYQQQVIFDGIANTGTFFESGSLDSTSKYIKCTSVGGVTDSATSAQIDVGANAQTTSVPAANAWVLINSNTWAATEEERTTVDSDGITLIDALDDVVLPVSFSVSIEPASGTNKTMQCRLINIDNISTDVTFTNGTNTINETGTALSDGDTISFYDTTGTLPAELRTDIIYYVVNQATNSFQVSYTSGGAAVAFTDDGTPTNNYKTAQINGILASANVDAGDAKSISRFGLVSVETNDKIGLIVRNGTDTNDINVTSGGYIVG
jgi:hypothetical protein